MYIKPKAPKVLKVLKFWDTQILCCFFRDKPPDPAASWAAAFRKKKMPPRIGDKTSPAVNGTWGKRIHQPKGKLPTNKMSSPIMNLFFPPEMMLFNDFLLFWTVLGYKLESSQSFRGNKVRLSSWCDNWGAHFNEIPPIWWIVKWRQMEKKLHYLLDLPPTPVTVANKGL